MNLVLLLKRERLKEEIKNSLNQQTNKETLKHLERELVKTEKQIRLQCKIDGHNFGTNFICYENVYGKKIYEQTCDICGAIKKVKKINIKSKHY